MIRNFTFCFAAWFLTAGILFAEQPTYKLRPWIKTDGTETKATFVEKNDDDVILRSEDGSETFTIPFSKLKRADKNYVEFQLAQLLKEPANKPAYELRTWTTKVDDKTNTIKGTFVENNRNEVTLRSEDDSETFKVKLSELIQEDKVYIRNIERDIEAAREHQADRSVIDPIQEGRHVIFAANWLELVGDGNDGTITREQFEAWRERIDKLCEYYEKFMDYKALRGNKFFIDLQPPEYWMERGREVPAGNPNRINRGRSSVETFTGLQGMRADNTISGTMMHEFGHTYTPPSSNNRMFHSDRETIADFMRFYATENCGFQLPSDKTIPGARHRQSYIQSVLRKFNQNKDLPPFRKGTTGYLPEHANRTNNAYELYMYGLVDFVGWETFGKAIRSYRNGTYVPAKTYNETMTLPNGQQTSTPAARAHEFFDCLAHFHDEARASTDPEVLRNIPLAGRNLTGAQVLRCLTDQGEFLDKYFTVETTPPSTKTETPAQSGPRPAWMCISDDRAAELFNRWNIVNGYYDYNEEDYRGRKNVLVTYPHSQEIPCSLERRINVLPNRKTVLTAIVSNHQNTDWELVLRVNGSVEKTVLVNEESTKGGWKKCEFDLTPFAGMNNVLIQLEHKAAGKSEEAGYWTGLTIIGR
ncbi:MAG: hypothetical protein FWE67_06720 [Planctomycetaceae bacterium]|nr:hypothetical protein [Planctomycetaceae bacterium]